MKRMLFLILILPLLLTPKAFSSMSSYCATPPFVSRTIAPNVMIVLDNSGSMFNFAYDYNGSDVSTGFNPDTSYYGYFDGNYWYKYESEKFVPTASKSDRGKNSNEWDGNFLNWLTMRRIDIARKALVGGKYSGGYLIGEKADLYGRGYMKKITNAELYTPHSGTKYFEFDVGGSGTSRFRVCSNCSCSWSWWYDAYLCSCSGCSGYLNVKPQVDSEPEGIVQRVGDEVRWGLSFYHVNWPSGKQGGYVQVNIGGGNIENMINEINNKNPDSNTPLAETLWTVAGYFAQETSMLGGPGPRYQSGDYQINDNVDPYNYGTGGSPQMAWCAKSFVIYITDGEPCGDDNLPNELKNYATNHGGYSYSGDLPPCDAGGNNPWIEDVALYVHTNDLRDDLEGNQTLTIYPIFAFGSGSELLKDAAINGGFTDKNNNNKPDLQSEWDQDGDGIPDNYYEAQNGSELESALSQAIADILRRTSSGTAVSVLSTSARGSGFLSQAYFTPSEISYSGEELTWVGEMKGFWVDLFGQIREDSDHTVNSTIQLEYDEDNIIKFFFDADSDPLRTRAHLYASDTTGAAESPCVPINGPKELDKLQYPNNYVIPIWDVGEKLWEKSPSNRKIYTSLNASSLTELKADSSTASSLKSYLRAYDDADALNIIKYIRGEDVDICLDSDDGTCSSTGHRNRSVTISSVTNVWKLGDIVYSNPKVLSRFPLGTYDIRYHDSTYRDFIREKVYDPTQSDPIKRDDYLFVGANDGMLHCFYLGRIKENPDPADPSVKAAVIKPSGASYDVGEEVWTYIPMNVLPYLKYLAYTDYCHIYYVDQRSMLLDASINGSASADKTKDSWRTILIGELRFGGSPNPPSDAPCIDNNGNLVSCSTPGAKKVGLSSIFALDITDPENPSLLWEFSDTDLGFTTSYPTVVRIGDASKNGNWYVVVGSGPTDYNGDTPPSQGYIYVINLRDGSLAGKLPLPAANSYTGDCVAVDPENDYSVDAIYCGTVEKQPNGDITGRMMRILTGETAPTKDANDTITNWTSTTLVNTDGPITASPEFAFDDQGNLWCYFGTGKYFGSTDKTSTAQQYIYGVKDTCWGYNNGAWGYGTTCNAVTNIYDTTNIEVSASVADYICMCEGGKADECKDESGGCSNCSSAEVKKVVTKVTGVTVSNCGGYTDWQACANYIANNYEGWRITLGTSSPAERVIAKPSVIGQIAMFTTFTPNSDICGFGGNSYLYSLYYKAGIPYKQPTILREEAYLNGTLEKAVLLGQGAPAIGEGIVSKKVGRKLKTYIQLSTGQIVELTNQPVFLPSKIQFWIEK